jgi:hypothetical protein
VRRRQLNSCELVQLIQLFRHLRDHGLAGITVKGSAVAWRPLRGRRLRRRSCSAAQLHHPAAAFAAHGAHWCDDRS